MIKKLQKLFHTERWWGKMFFIIFFYFIFIIIWFNIFIFDFFSGFIGFFDFKTIDIFYSFRLIFTSIIEFLMNPYFDIMFYFYSLAPIIGFIIMSKLVFSVFNIQYFFKKILIIIFNIIFILIFLRVLIFIILNNLLFGIF